MSSLTTNPVNLADHRTKLVADAVISAYLSEISRPQPGAACLGARAGTCPGDHA